MTTRFRSVRDSVVTDHFPDVSRRRSSFLKRFLVAMTISSGAMLVVGDVVHERRQGHQLRVLDAREELVEKGVDAR